MFISVKETPLPFMHLRVWDLSGNIVPILRWFNSDTMVASVPTKISGAEIRTKIGRFEFITTSEIQIKQLKQVLLNKELYTYIKLISEED